MTRTTTLLTLGMLACTPGHPDTLVGDTSTEALTGTEETGDGDPGDGDPPRGDGDEETTGATETGETGDGDGDSGGDGDGDPGVHACADPGGEQCYVPPWGELCPEGLEDPCEWAGVDVCIEPFGGCIIDYNVPCPDGWVSACE